MFVCVKRKLTGEVTVCHHETPVCVTPCCCSFSSKGCCFTKHKHEPKGRREKGRRGTTRALFQHSPTGQALKHEFFCMIVGTVVRKQLRSFLSLCVSTNTEHLKGHSQRCSSYWSTALFESPVLVSCSACKHLSRWKLCQPSVEFHHAALGCPLWTLVSHSGGQATKNIMLGGGSNKVRNAVKELS